MVVSYLCLHLLHHLLRGISYSGSIVECSAAVNPHKNLN